MLRIREINNNNNNNAIKNDYTEAKIDHTQQNNKDKTINNIKSQCNELIQNELKSRHDWVGRVIHWELWKILKLYRADKWYMQKPETVLENKKHEIHCVEINTYNELQGIEYPKTCWHAVKMRHF